MRIAVCTLKSWNVERALALKGERERAGDAVLVVTSREGLTRDALEEFGPDYVFFPHWSSIIPEEVYGRFECVVFHMTDLPFGRGGSPLQNLIARGFKETKISAIRVVGGLDAGPVYLKRPLDLSGSAREIYVRASELVFSEMIPFILRERPAPVPQSGEVVEFARRKPCQSEIPEDADLGRAYDWIRMLDAEGYPRAFVRRGGLRFEFEGARLVDGAVRAEVTVREESEDGE